MGKRIKFSLVYRDMWQSSGKYQPRLDQLVQIAPLIIEMGCFDRVETNGGAFEQVNLLYGENPNKAVRAFTKPFNEAGIQTHMLDRGLNALRMYPVPADVRRLMYKVKKAQGVDITRIFCGLNDVRNIIPSIKYANEAGMIPQATLCITFSPVHTVEYYTGIAEQLIAAGAPEICLKDMAGIGRPVFLGRLVKAIKDKHPDVIIQYHGHSGPGLSMASILEVCKNGADIIDVAMEPMSWGKVHPDVISVQAMLKDAGFDVVPILLNPRSMGRLPQMYATLDGINTFILRVTLDDGKFAYLDGTDPDSDVDLLPTELLVDRARIYGVDGNVGWCDISQLSPSSTVINMNLHFDSDLSLRGWITERFTNQSAMQYSSACTKAGSEEKYAEGLEESHHIRIDSLTINGRGSALLTQQYAMTRETEKAGDFIYLDATVIPFLSENPFRSAERSYPVEFDNADSYLIQGTIRLPEGYVVEELPRAVRLNAFNGDITCSYIVQAANGAIQFRMQFKQKRLIFQPGEYADLQAFYGAVVNMCNGKIVLRKQQ